MSPRAPSAAFPRVRWRDGRPEAGHRELPEEAAVALVHDATTTAVMMATPADLEDFAVGFSLTEGLVASADEILGLDVEHGELGVEVRAWLARPSGARLAERRRRIAGPTGCGLCGVDSLAEAARPLPRVGQDLRLTADLVQSAVRSIATAQQLGAATRAVHAAGYWRERGGLAALREDVGRHNALDKLAGAMARQGLAQDDGVLVLTSRVSVEMVQKAAVMGVQVIAAISAPTALAVRVAQASGIGLAAVVREDGFEVFSGHERFAR
jgi:FdhD protein